MDSCGTPVLVSHQELNDELILDPCFLRVRQASNYIGNHIACYSESCWNNQRTDFRLPFHTLLTAKGKFSLACNQIFKENPLLKTGMTFANFGLSGKNPVAVDFFGVIKELIIELLNSHSFNILVGI